MTTEQIIDAVIAAEGGYVDDPADAGGATCYGITQGTLAKWRGTSVSKEDVQNLSINEARDIYRNEYVAPWDWITSAPKLKSFVVDCTVNHGITQATKLLQRALGVTDDGIIGDETRFAMLRVYWSRVLIKMIGQRFKLYGRIITDNPSQAKFAAGWMNRTVVFLDDVA